MIKKIYKKDILDLFNETWFWSNETLPISKHRLMAHYTNPVSDPEDIALILAVKDGSIVGYMGVYIDEIKTGICTEKIGWLSTWYVDIKMKGQGIGRLLLTSMYEELNGQIGVSQFTPSAKRVYNKSGLFKPLTTSLGYKYVIRSNLEIVMPLINKKFANALFVLRVIDNTINLFVNFKIFISQKIVKKKLSNISLEYISNIDRNLDSFINEHNKDHLCPKAPCYFNWLKNQKWVNSAPIMSLVQEERYQFSMYSNRFEFFYVEIYEFERLIGFVVLQTRNKTLKVLYSYFDISNAAIITRVILLHAYKLKTKELICYDKSLNEVFNSTHCYLYKKLKRKESIISKVFDLNSNDEFTFNYGDGDCSFA